MIHDRTTIDSFVNESQISIHTAIPPNPLSSTGSTVVQKTSSEAVIALASQASLAKQKELSNVLLESDSNGTNKLDKLKTAVLQRNSERTAILDKEAAVKAAELEYQRFRCLPAFCDLIRMMFNRKRKTVISMPEFMKTLTEETTIGIEEYKKRLYLVCDIIPDFLTLIPPDDISPDEFLKVNVYCNYKECMERLHCHIETVINAHP